MLPASPPQSSGQPVAFGVICSHVSLTEEQSPWKHTVAALVSVSLAHFLLPVREKTRRVEGPLPKHLGDREKEEA